MALKRLLAGSLLLLCLLCGCTDQQMAGASKSAEKREGSGTVLMEPSADAGSAAQQTDPSKEDNGTDERVPLQGLVFCLDPGHGITSESRKEQVSPLSTDMKPAFVSGASGQSQTEEELNLAVADLLRAKLESLGATVVMTRETNEATVSNIERAQIANHAHADLCIRIHADGIEDSSVSGMSMQIPDGDLLCNPDIIEPSAEAAEIILNTVTETVGARNRGSVKRSDLTGFNWSEVPCILLEMGFLSNPTEDEKLADDDYRQLIAEGVADGICQWAESRG